MLKCCRENIRNLSFSFFFLEYFPHKQTLPKRYHFKKSTHVKELNKKKKGKLKIYMLLSIITYL